MGFALPPSLNNALKYTGDQIADIPGVNNPRAPTISDRNYPLFTLWRNSSKTAVLPDMEGDMWYLARFDSSTNQNPADAIWLKLATGSVPGGSLISLSDTASTKVFGDASQNIQLTAGAGVSIISTPASNLITFGLTGGGIAIDQINVDAHTAPGTDPVLPTGTGEITITGAQVATGTIGANVIRTDSLAANSLTIEIQRSTAVAATDSTKNGVCHFDSAEFTVDASGFVSLSGGGLAVDSFQVQSITAPGVNPVTPTGAGLVTVNAAAVAAHSTPIETRSRALNTYNIEVQEAAAVAATDITKSGISHFDSARFTVDANGFVSANGSGLGQTITPDSGGALNPTLGNWNIFGGPGVTTTGSGSTLTINSVVYTDRAVGAVLASDSGTFATAAETLTLPAAPAQGELIEIVCAHAGPIIVQANTGQTIKINQNASSVAGTATNTAIGDSLSLRYQSTGAFWWTTSQIGLWSLA